MVKEEFETIFLVVDKIVELGEINSSGVIFLGHRGVWKSPAFKLELEGLDINDLKEGDIIEIRIRKKV